MNSRVESRSGFWAWELGLAARKLVEDVMLVKPGECVVLTADSSSDDRVVQAVATAVVAARAHPVVVWYEDPGAVAQEPVQPVAEAIRSADVWIEFGLSYIFHSDAFKRAIAAGVRYICLPAMDVAMIIATLGKVDLALCSEFGTTLQRIVERSSHMEVTSSNGTRLSAEMGGRPVLLRGKPAEFPGETVMLAGQVSWNPVEESMTGVIVFDGTVWPPDEVGLLSEPIRCEIERGRVVDVSGGEQAVVLQEWLESFGDPNMYRVAHISPGFNPGVTRPTGRISEDERLFGGLNVGIGTKGAWLGGATWSAPAHTDGTIRRLSMELDGSPICVDGRYVDESLARIAEALGVRGYKRG